MSNVPDDWGASYGRCHFCKQIFHSSGTVECACERCDFCECDFPPLEEPLLVSGMTKSCEPCAETGAWSWAGTDLDKRLFKLSSAVDEGLNNTLGIAGLLLEVEMLQTTLEQVRKKLVKGFTAQ